MSKIGLKPIDLPSGITFKDAAGGYEVSGPKGTLTVNAQTGIKVEQNGNTLLVAKTNEERQTRANHGLVRSLLFNAVVGVKDEFSKTLELVGVGYRAKTSGDNVEFSLGYSHPILYKLPDGISASVPDQTTVIVSGIDKQKVGQVAAEMRALRPPEPYKGKGVKYKDERIIRKAGKSGGK